MRIVCLGGGPAGLYFAISMKLRQPDADIRVVERNKAGDTFGWGVVFSDQTVANLMANDPVSARTISDSFAHWDAIEVVIGEERIRSGGHGFIGIFRKRLLQILQDRARELGIELVFETEFSDDLSAYADDDLIVACDGINSRIRTAYEDRFAVDIQTRANKFMWLGTHKLFDAFEFIFERTEAGWIWAHAYRFDDSRSTFIVECSEETWRGLGFDRMEQADAIALAERIFARHLDGHALITNAAHLRGSAAWINFRRILCNQWSFDNVVLLGDAAHTAHFSIGSGTKLALEDAMKLAAVLDRPDIADPATLRQALADYQAERQVEVLKIQNAARNSTEWFETIDRYIDFEPIQFAYALLTRSQRVSHENLRLRDPRWLGDVERWFATGATVDAPPPMFTPFTLRGLTLPNRIVVSPLLTYKADADGRVGDFHLVHYGARAQGGAGLVVTEMAAVAAEGRITPACPGLYDDAQVAGWRRITDFIHAETDSKVCAQIGHAGARGATAIPVDGRGYDVPLPEGGWPLLSASAAPWRDGGACPAALTEADMTRLVAQFVAATERAAAAGFDMIEIQAGHGYLLSAFITPLMNRRSDAHGGDLDARLHFPLRVIRAVRAAWRADRPLAARISASDWSGAAGIEPADAVAIARAFAAEGVDLIDVSSGETSSTARPVYGRMYQTPFADRIRNEAGCATMAVGAITEADHANSILAAGRADLVALGRPHLVDPMWTLRAAAAAGYRGVHVPSPYAMGQAQLAQTLKRAADMAVG
jgi:anthraniloyl-CoA monooxygenase